MGKTIVLVGSLICGMLTSMSASALDSFTCKFGENGNPCHQLKGGLCQTKFAAEVYVACGNLADSFVCLFTRKQLSTFSSKAAMLKAGSDDATAYAFAMVDPGAGNLTLAFRKYLAECDISQTK
jgi:hypothetical protein